MYKDNPDRAVSIESFEPALGRWVPCLLTLKSQSSGACNPQENIGLPTLKCSVKTFGFSTNTSGLTCKIILAQFSVIINPICKGLQSIILPNFSLEVADVIRLIAPHLLYLVRLLMDPMPMLF